MNRPTSTIAYKSVSDRVASMRTRVFERLMRCWTTGATDEEIQETLNMNPSTERPRRGELEKSGLVINSGITRKTRSGRDAIVWMCAGAYRDMLRGAVA